MGSTTLEYVKPSVLRQYIIFPGVRFTFWCHVCSDEGSRKHQCLGLNLVANAATSSGIVQTLCKQVSVLPFFVHAMSSNIDMQKMLSSKDSGFCPFKCFRMCFLISVVEAPGNTCQMNRTSRAATLNVSIHVRSTWPSIQLPDCWMDLDSRLQHTMWNLRTRELSS